MTVDKDYEDKVVDFTKYDYVCFNCGTRRRN